MTTTTPCDCCGATKENPRMGRPSIDGKPGRTKQRQIRIAEDVWYAAAAKAEAQGTTASQIVRDLLADWVAHA